MPAGITSSDSMFSVRQTPWHGLGAVLDQPPATIAEAIQALGLGWRVKREPIAVDRGDTATVDDWWEPRCEEIPGYYATVRQDTRTVLGIRAERAGVSVRRPALGVEPELPMQPHPGAERDLKEVTTMSAYATSPAQLRVLPSSRGDDPTNATAL